MANNVKNSTGGDTGNAKNGSITVNTGGRGAIGQIAKFYGPEPDYDGLRPTIASFSDLDGRLDEPRYYTGDAVT